MRSVNPATPVYIPATVGEKVRKYRTSSASVSGLPSTSQVPNRRQLSVRRSKSPTTAKLSTGVPQPRRKPAVCGRIDSRVKKPSTIMPSGESASNTVQIQRARVPSQQVAVVLTALAEGLDPSAAERVFGFRQATITTWLTRAGKHAQTLHER